MRARIFSFVKVSEDSMIASVRIARFLSETLQIPITWAQDVANEPLDVLMIVNGAYAFAGNDLLAALGDAIFHASRVIWVQNDYTIIPPKEDSGAESPFRKAFRDRHVDRKSAIDYWTTVQAMSRPGVAKSGHVIGQDSSYVNWNCLTTESIPTRPWEERSAAEATIYYGAFRKDRKRSFDRYFTTPTVPTLISCPNDKFREYDHPLIEHESKIVGSLYEYLSHFGMGLYLEDYKSHSEFHSPANRFYEMLSAGLPIAFEPECQRMMDRAGYDVGRWILWNPTEARRMIDRGAEILREQREAFWERVKQERETLDVKVQDLWTRYAT